MKKLFLLLLIGSISITAKSQDTIVTKKGEDMMVKVIEVNMGIIRYKKLDNINGPIFEIQKTDVFMLKYENGIREVLVDNSQSTPLINSLTPTYQQGVDDAKRYYHKRGGAAAGTFFATLVAGGLLGLIPAIITSSHTPKDKNLDYPNASFMQNPEYYKGYTHKAKSRKSARIWTMYGVAVGINVAVAVILLTTGDYGY